MSSGNFAGPAGFNNIGKPADNHRACPYAYLEPRGPGVFFTGTCWLCGVSTTSRDGDGRPRHLQVIPATGIDR